LLILASTLLGCPFCSFLTLIVFTPTTGQAMTPLVDTVALAFLLASQICAAHRVQTQAEMVQANALATGIGGFPSEVGPYYLFDAALNDLDYGGNQGWGIKLQSDRKGWTTGDATGALSAEKHGAPPGLAASFGLSEDAIHRHAFAYPDPAWVHDAGATPQALFKRNGGYIYFNDCDEIVAAKGIAPSSSLLKFGAAEECVSCKFDECPGESQFMDYQPVSIEAVKAFSTHYCWLPPRTCAKKNPKHRDGCFAFKKKHGDGFLLFPVATEQEPGAFPGALGPFLLTTAHDDLSKVSQWNPVTMPVPLRTNIGVPIEATAYMWAYETGRKDLAGLHYGGFFFSPNHGTNNLFVDGLSDADVGKLGAVAKRVVLTQAKMSFSMAVLETYSLDSCSPWHDIANKEVVPGAKRFCWDITGPGSFVYEMEDGSVVGFPMESV